MWPNPQFPVDLITFIEEILNAKLNFLCSARAMHPPNFVTSSQDFHIEFIKSVINLKNP